VDRGVGFGAANRRAAGSADPVLSNNSILLKTQAIGPAFEDRKDDVKKLFAGDVTFMLHPVQLSLLDAPIDPATVIKFEQIEFLDITGYDGAQSCTGSAAHLGSQ
jgi:hypothetical protein